MTKPDAPDFESEPASIPSRAPEALDSTEGATATPIKRLLRGAFSEAPAAEVDVLGGVQRKLRERSGGKFYADGWSTARQPPVATYLVTSLLMLAVVAALYAVLVPLRGEPKLAPEPKPVQVLPHN